MPYANPEDRRRNSRKNYLNNREKRLAYAKAYRESHKAQIKAYWDSPEGQEYHREKAREHYWRNREKYIEHSKEYRRRHPEKIKDYKERTRARRSETHKAWYSRNKEHIRAYNREYIVTHPEAKEYKKWKMRCYLAEVDAKCRADAEFYARHRAKARVNYAKRQIKSGKPYSPNVARRIPDTECKRVFCASIKPNGLSTTEAIANIGYGIAMNSARFPKK